MPTVSSRIVQTGYPIYTVARFTMTGSDVPNYGETRVLPSNLTTFDSSKTYCVSYVESRTSPDSFDMYIPSLTADLHVPPASGSAKYIDMQLWGYNKNSGVWEKLGASQRIYVGYAWLADAECSTVSGQEEHELKVIGYTRAYIPKDDQGRPDPSRGNCWYQNIGFVKASDAINSDGTYNVTVAASKVIGATAARFEIVETPEFTYARLSTIVTGLPHLTTCYAYGQGRNGTWYLLNSQFVDSQASSYSGYYAIHATTLGAVMYYYNNGSGHYEKQTFSPGNVTLKIYRPTKSESAQYKVTFNPNNGSVTPTEATADRTILYDFVEWNTASDGSGDTYVGGRSYNLQQDLDLYAIYSMRSDSTDVITLPTPTRSGYSFDGWYTSGGTKVGDAGDDYVPTGNITLYAHWSANAYSVSYDANGGSNAPDPQSKIQDVTLTLSSQKPTKSFNLTYDARSGSLPSGTTNPVSRACTFVNWKATNGTTYDPGDSYTANEGTTMTAQWSNPTVGTLPTPTRSGYRFAGWYTETGGSGTKVTASTTMSGDLAIYAYWIQQFTLSYDLRGGSGSLSSHTVDTGSDVSLRNYTGTCTHTWTFDATSGGEFSSGQQTATADAVHTFKGWATSAARAQAGTVDYANQGTYPNITSNVTLYAVWNDTQLNTPTPAKTARLTYNANGGSVSPTSENVSLVHAGWKNEAGTSISKNPTVSDVGYSGSYELTARYSSGKDSSHPTPTKSVTLTYDPNGATIPTAANRTKQVALVFGGWADSSSAASADYSVTDEITVPEAGKIVYAVWSAAEIGSLPGENIFTQRSEYRLDSDKPWTTTKNGSTAATPSMKISQDTSIYALWEYLVTLDLQGGNAYTPGADPEDPGSIISGPITGWKKHGATYSVSYHYGKVGSTMSGFATSDSGSVSYPDTVDYSGNAPIKLYAVWGPVMYQVTFHDGFSPKGQDIISVTSVPYGGSVADQDIPVVGRSYGDPYNKVFQKPGSSEFSRWMGSYRNITADSDVIAMWDFTPVWICVPNGNSRKWVKYEPSEE